MRPLDAFDAALYRGMLDSCAPRKPGAVIQRMHGEAREALSGLTSADLATLRPEAWLQQSGARRGRLTKALEAK